MINGDYGGSASASSGLNDLSSAYDSFSSAESGLTDVFNSGLGGLTFDLSLPSNLIAPMQFVNNTILSIWQGFPAELQQLFLLPLMVALCLLVLNYVRRK